MQVAFMLVQVATTLLQPWLFFAKVQLALCPLLLVQRFAHRFM
jgi:hypothetical protein